MGFGALGLRFRVYRVRVQISISSWGLRLIASGSECKAEGSGLRKEVSSLELVTGAAKLRVWAWRGLGFRV